MTSRPAACRALTIDLNSSTWPPGEPDGAVGPVRGEETDAVVTPIIAQAPLQQVGVLDELVDRHQLDSRHPEVDQITDYGGMGQPRVGPAQLGRARRGGAESGPLTWVS